MTDASSRPRGALRVSLSTSTREVSRSRRLVRDWLARHGVNSLNETAVLLVSELVTNALMHGRPPLELRVRVLDTGGVRVEVLDAAGGEPPVRRRASLDAATGRGIGIVATLAARWGSQPVTAGKLVWAELDPVRSRTST